MDNFNKMNNVCISSIVFVVGFLSGYLTKYCINKEEKEIAKLFLFPCSHQENPHNPPDIKEIEKNISPSSKKFYYDILKIEENSIQNKENNNSEE